MRRLTVFWTTLTLALAVTAAPFKDGKGLFNRRLGMFVHWGVYSVGAWHEQEFSRCGLSRAEYEKRLGGFTAEKFDADRFVDLAESAGAEYVVITAKHHDGFCLWDTKTTDYNAVRSPAKRDLLRELADACHRRGMGIGFYFSNPDWHAPFAHNDKSTHQVPLQPGDKPDMEKYVAYVKAQVTELCSNYGELCCFFWDIPTHVARPEMDELVRRLQPGIMINDRGWENRATCDYSTPERDFKAVLPDGKQVEACDSVGQQSWGYRANEDYRSVGYLTRRIDRFLSAGGNFLINVGPKPDGTMPDEAVAIMAKVGSWLGKVRDSYRDVVTVTDIGDRRVPAAYTRRGDTLFVHFPNGLDATGVDLGPLARESVRATLLNTGKELKAKVEVMPWNAKASAVYTPAKPTLHVWGIPVDDCVGESVVIRLDFPPDALMPVGRAK